MNSDLLLCQAYNHFQPHPSDKDLKNHIAGFPCAGKKTTNARSNPVHTVFLVLSWGQSITGARKSVYWSQTRDWLCGIRFYVKWSLSYNRGAKVILKLKVNGNFACDCLRSQSWHGTLCDVRLRGNCILSLLFLCCCFTNMPSFCCLGKERTHRWVCRDLLLQQSSFFFSLFILLFRQWN